MQPNEIAIERERGPVPDEPVHAIAEEGDLRDISGVVSEHGVAVGPRGRSAARPVEIHEAVMREIGMQRDAEQATLRSRIDREIEHYALPRSIHHPFDLARALLEHEEIVRAEERDAGR